MNLDPLEDGGPAFAEPVLVFKGGLVIEEEPLEGGFEIPATDGGAVGATSPKLAVRDGVSALPSTSVARMWKSMSRPLTLSTISGWPEVMERFRARPLPRFSIITPSRKGSRARLRR
ncbi:MAG: hypothetical protein H7A46_08520 [Verrucomicrobiales bacterium]|nr:hypothetical protein [Verrucomicrobiales bacterium]